MSRRTILRSGPLEAAGALIDEHPITDDEARAVILNLIERVIALEANATFMDEIVQHERRVLERERS